MLSQTKRGLWFFTFYACSSSVFGEERLLVDPLFQQILNDFKADTAAIAAKYYVTSFNANNQTNANNELLKQTAQRYNLTPQDISNFFNTTKTTPLGNDSWSATLFHVRKTLFNWSEPLINLTSVDLSKATNETFIINQLQPLLPDQTLLTSYDYEWITPSIWQLIKLKQTQKVTCEQLQSTNAQLDQRVSQSFATDFSTFSHYNVTDLENAALLAMTGKILTQEGYPVSIFPLWLNILVFGLEELANLQHDDLAGLQQQVALETNQVKTIATHLQTYPATLPTDATQLQSLSTDMDKQITTLEDVDETCLGSTGKATLLLSAQQKQTKLEIALETALDANQQSVTLANQVVLETNQINAIAAHLQSYPAVLPTDLAQLQNLNTDLNTQIAMLEDFEETVPNSTGKTAVLTVAVQLQTKIEDAIDNAKELLSAQERLKVTYQQLSTVALQSPSASFTSDDFDYALSEIIKPNVTLKTMITLLDNLDKLRGSTLANAGAAKSAYDDLFDAVQVEIDSVNNFTLQLFVNPKTVNNPLFGYQGVNFYVTNGPKNVSNQLLMLYNINRQHPLDISPLNNRIFNGEMRQNIMDALYMKQPKLVRSDWIDVNNFKDQFQSALRGSGLFISAADATGTNYMALSDLLAADLFLE